MLAGEMARAESCFRCGLENPETFPACARCHAPIGKASRTHATSSSTRISSDDFAPFQSEEFSVTEAIAAVDRAMLGRDAAVETARAALVEAYARTKPTVLVIEGARGMGTSRMLLHSAHLAVGLESNVRLLHGICVDGRDGEFAPFPRVLLDRFGITPASAEVAARARVTTEVADVLGSSDAVAISTMAHLVGHVAGLDFPDSPILRAAQAAPDDRSAKLRDAIARFLVLDAQRRSVWIGVDNAQKMDELAWGVIADVLREKAPVAVVLAGSVGLAELAKRHLPESSVKVATLEPLDEFHVGELVKRILPTLRRLPEPLVSAIAHRTSGNPAEVRQLVFSLYEMGLFRDEPGGALKVDMAKFESGEMPISMDDVLVARFSRLPSNERRTLEYASICGESFWDGAILCQLRIESEDPDQAVDDEDPEDDALAIAGDLHGLIAKGFIVANAGAGIVPANEYRFSVGRMRAIAYSSVPETRRRTRHLSVARWLDVAASNHRDTVAATIGFHLESAGDLTGAGVAYARAGAHERARRRFDRALRWLDRADACTPANDPMARLDLAHDRGAVLVSSGRIDEAIVAFTRMHALARRLGARAKQAAALDRIARAHLSRGQPSRALPLLERALTLGRIAEDRRGIASCLDDLAQVELVLGRVARAHMAATEALEIRRTLADARGESVSLTTLGRIALRRGELSLAEERLRAALVIRESLGELEGIVQTLTALGRVAFERGDRDAAIDLWQRALPIAHDLGDRRAEQLLLSHVGEACLVLARFGGAESSLTRSRELAVELDDRRSIARLDVLLGRMAMRRGDERAPRMLKLALESAEASGSRDLIGLAHRALGQLYATVASNDESAANKAARHLQKSVGAFREAESSKEIARSQLDLAHLLESRGDPQGARSHADSAVALLEGTQLPELAVARRMATK